MAKEVHNKINLDPNEVIAAYREVGNTAIVGKLFGVSYRPVRRILMENGIKIPKIGTGHRRLLASPEEVVAKYKDIPSTTRVAEFYGVSVGAVIRRMNEIGFRPDNQGFKSRYFPHGKNRKKHPEIYKYRTCVICGTKFRWFPSQRNKRHCSKECQYKSAQKLKDKKCKECGTIFSPRTSKQVCCSLKCANTNHAIKKNCVVCGNLFKVFKGRQKAKCCSSKCAGKYRSKEYRGDKSRAWQGGKTHPKCIYCGKKITWNQTRCRSCMGKQMRGSDHHNWKGGYSDERKAWMTREEYKEWRMAIYKRDDYTCQLCRARGGYLNAHHIIPISSDRERIRDISNGITLCRPCHLKTYGKEIKYLFWFFAILGAKGFAA